MKLVPFAASSGSTYRVLNTDTDLFVSYRRIDPDDYVYRVRLHGKPGLVKAAYSALLYPSSWTGGCVGTDHISIDTPEAYLANVLADATRAIVLTLGSDPSQSGDSSTPAPGHSVENLSAELEQVTYDLKTFFGKPSPVYAMDSGKSILDLLKS